ncbi:MAG TPA: hypothetical protein VLX92_02720 [Kofleriaceae bacterium]|nr:hypothetical protein [Kofleriaceae bacterium]
MTDLERLNDRIDRVERKLRSARAVAVTMTVVAIAAVIACKRDAGAVPPPSSLEFKTPGGVGRVKIDSTGIEIEGLHGTTHVGAGEIDVGDDVVVSGEHVVVRGEGDTKATLAADTLALEHDDESVKLSLGSGAVVAAMTRSNQAVLSTGNEFAGVSAHFGSDATGNHEAALSADETGGKITTSDGKTEKRH